MSRSHPLTTVLIAPLLLLLLAPCAWGDGLSLSQITFHPNDLQTRAGFEHFYNLEYDKAIQEFEQVRKANPEDPFCVNHVLAGVMFRELYRIGALDTELYAKESFLTSKHFPADSKVRDRINQLIADAQALEEKRLQANPNDVDALFARGVTRGMKSTYMGLVDKAWFAALRNAVGARHDHEKVLELKPDYSDAKTIVGVHYYVLGSLTWPVKIAASVVGLSGSKSKGIEYLYEAVHGGGEASLDARIALALFLRREQRYAEAIPLVHELAVAFPRDFLYALEEAHLENAAGRGQEAIANYRRVLELARQGKYPPEARMEMASYGLAEALRGQHDYSASVEAYEQVSRYPNVDPELQRRATLAQGQLYDLEQKRDLAVKKYEAVIASDGSSSQAEIAKKLLKQPYREQ